MAGDTMIMPLLTTKLHVPPISPDLVPRPHLLRKLDNGLRPGNRMIMVCAPAGFGKSTLLSQWLASHKRKAAWLSLDDGDNDAIRFWTYLITALQNVEPGLGRKTLQLLHSSEPTTSTLEEWLRSLLPLLINQAVSLSQKVILVLEDFQAISSPAIHNSLAFFIEHLPANLKLVISTRVNPPLPLVRLRARGELAELLAYDLRFTLDEARVYLNDIMRLHLEPEDISNLNARTEGWATGLKLAALSMEGRSDKHEFIASFTGSDRYILEYLSTELLERQHESVRSFLLETGILRRFCASLCNAVTNRDDSDAMLGHLQRINLFIIPLDDRGHWFRYHHLFADFLRGRLQQLHPDLFTELHTRAADWYDRNDLPEEVIYHALINSDFNRVEQLIVKTWKKSISEGGVGTVLNWLDNLPADRVRSNPLLNIARCQVLCLTGQMRELESTLDEVESTWTSLITSGNVAVDSPDYATVPAQIAILKAFVAYHKGDFDKGITLARQGLKMVPESKVKLRGWASFGLACAYQETGHYAKAMTAFIEATDLLKRGKNWSAAMVSMQRTAQIQQAQGHLDQAFQTCQEGLRIIREEGMEDMPAAAAIYLTLADIFRERNELQKAEEYLHRALKLSKLGGVLYISKDCALLFAKLKLAQGNIDEALVMLHEAELTAKKLEDPLAKMEVAAYRARAWIEQGNPTNAVRWMEEIAHQHVGQDGGYMRMLKTMTAIRILIAQHRPSQALEQLVQFLADAEKEGRTYGVIEALTLMAVAYKQHRDGLRSYASLERALELAEPEGFMRIFLDDGKPVESLLSKLKSRILQKPRLSDYVDRLLTAYIKEPYRLADKTGRIQGKIPKFRVQPKTRITPRELEVLQLIGEGYSNQQIAIKLVVTIATVKKHNSNIFDKLGVSSRTQAIVRAQKTGLL